MIIIFHVFQVSNHFGPLKPLMLQFDCTKVLEILMSLSESHVILLNVVWFVKSLLENHATCTVISAASSSDISE